MPGALRCDLNTKYSAARTTVPAEQTNGTEKGRKHEEEKDPEAIGPALCPGPLLSLAAPALATEEYELLFSNMNGEKVQSGPPKVKQFIFREDKDPVLIHQITTYHFNNRKGTEAPGTISIWEGDELLGEWQAAGRSYDGISNLYWDVFPDFVMMPGHSYVIRVSDHDSWSYNEESGDCGMLELYGAFMPGYVAPGGYDEIVTYRDIRIVLDGTLIISRDANGDVVDPFILDGTTYLPVRALSNALGFDVGWDNATSTVTISTGASSGGGQSSGSGWVMIYEKATQTPDYESPSGIYYDTYSWEKDEAAGLIRAYSTNEAKPDDSTRHYQCSQFETTCTIPPKSGAPGEKVLFDISAALLETIGDEFYFGANCTVQWAAPGKEPNIAGRLCMNVLDEGADWYYHPCGGDASVGGGSVNEGSSCTVYWIFPRNPQPGDQISVYFMTNAVQIEWCYEYKG